MTASGALPAYWARAPADVARALGTSVDGLASSDAEARLQRYGPNLLHESRRVTWLSLLLRQLRSPLLLMLVFAAIASAATAAWLDAALVLVIVAASTGVGYAREYRAHLQAAALAARVHTHTVAVRDGRPVRVPVERIVPGDIVLLSAGSLVPGDALLIDATDLFVSEAVLTGESFPAAKRVGQLPPETALPNRLNCVFLGTNVRSGTARCIVVATGRDSAYGAIAQRLVRRPPETDFERGLRRFGYVVSLAMLIMVLLVFAVHVLLGRPPIETLLFAIALAVGLSPELLPAILSVNLSRGSQMMAAHGVLVRRLNAIENLGSIDVLCTDKTGTLTEGVVTIEGAYDACGRPSPEVLRLGGWNAALETGIGSPLDDAILKAGAPDLASVEKLAEIPFDFTRKRVSVIARTRDGVTLVTKGAFDHVLDICTRAADGTPLDANAIARLTRRHEEWSAQGFRVLAIATGLLPKQTTYGREHEADLTFVGFLTFTDNPKPGVGAALADLAHLGVAVKMITGDNTRVAQHVARLVGLDPARVLTGSDLHTVTEAALLPLVERTDLFVEVDPNQKERIILALKKAGHTVGFLGDGVNDAPAMHVADTSLSVDDAVDVARDAADFVLLDRDLDVIRRGIEEGRRTFANTMKYIKTTTSANLGNMVSMAVVSLFLTFLPMLAGQILLNNLLSDVPAVGLADDKVDPEQITHPGRWNIRSLSVFMMTFGLISSAFDFLTFGVLRLFYGAAAEIFRTAWFVESLLTELIVALMVRTRRPLFRSRPGAVLLWSTVVLIPVTLAIPYLPIASLLGFVPLPGTLVATVCVITAAYGIVVELVKSRCDASKVIA